MNTDSQTKINQVFLTNMRSAKLLDNYNCYFKEHSPKKHSIRLYRVNTEGYAILIVSKGCFEIILMHKNNILLKRLVILLSVVYY